MSTNRDTLLKDNNDKLFGVYKLTSNTHDAIKIELIENALTCYPNQVENLVWGNNGNKIHILDLKEYMQGKIKTLISGEGELQLPENENMCYVSIGTHELFKKNGNIHYSVTQRDGGSNDEGLFSTVAGRATGKDIQEETARELAEERVCYFQSKIHIPQLENVDKEILLEYIKEALTYFKNTKLPYLNSTPEAFKKIFGVKHQQSLQSEWEHKINEILNNIKNKKNLDFYTPKDITEQIKRSLYKTTLGQNIKKVIISEKDTGFYHVVYDERTRGYEVKKVIINHKNSFPIYTESSTQNPQVVTGEEIIKESTNKYVPYLVEFAEQIEETKARILSLIP